MLGSLPPGYTFSRASAQWSFASDLTLTEYATDVPAWWYDPAGAGLQGLLVEPEATNLNRNSTGDGAAAGTIGTAPTNWSVSGTANSVVRTMFNSSTEDGIAFAKVRYAGTPSGTGSATIAFEATTQIAAVQGENFMASAFVALDAGSSMNNATLNIATNEFDSGGVFMAGGTALSIVPTTAALKTQRFSKSHQIVNATAAYCRGRLSLGYTAGNAIDVTLKIGLPQQVKSTLLTSPIPTTSAAVTRAAAVLTRTLPSGIYNIGITRASGVTSITGQVVTGNAYTVPTDVSPLQSITYRRTG